MTTFDNKEYFMMFLIGNSIGKNDIEYFGPRGFGWSVVSEYDYQRKHPNKIIIFISLRSLREATVESVLKSCYKKSNKLYVYFAEELSIKYIIIDQINSEILFKDQLQESFSKIKNDN
jgi:hypothetical protein